MKYLAAVKYLVLAGLLGILAGCKIAVIVTEGGQVQSTGSGTCLAGAVCIHEVTDTNYTESFTAVADQSWQFVRWNSGTAFFCGDSTAPTCVISNVGLAGNTDAEAFVATDFSYYLMPVFVKSASSSNPITDTVTAAGKEWAQVDLFAGLTWDDINAVCPANSAVCPDGASLNDLDVSGWTWADVADLNSLFNSYGVTPAMSGPSYRNQIGQTWTEAFYAAGWRANGGAPGATYGVVRTTSTTDSASFAPIIQDDSGDQADTRLTVDKDALTYGTGGAWFYKPI